MSGTMILMTSERLGSGDEALGRRLMMKFLHQLSTTPERPSAVGFYNGAVKLLAPSSPVLDALRLLDASGVELIACGTCVEQFGLLDELAVGRVSDMREIVSAMLNAERVITV